MANLLQCYSGSSSCHRSWATPSQLGGEREDFDAGEGEEVIGDGEREGDR